MGKGRAVAVLSSLVFLLTAAAGCGGGPAEVGDNARQEPAVTAGREETVPAERDQAQEPSPRTVSLGGAYVPAGFGEGSLWATEPATCDDTGSSEQYEGGGASAACAAPANMSLKRLDPRSGEEEATVELEGFFANVTEVAFGAGSVWVSSADYYPGPQDDEALPGDAVLRVDPGTNLVVDRIPVDSPSGVAFGHGSLWVTSAGRGTVWRINPETSEAAAEIAVGRGAVDVAVDERGGAVWIAGLYLPEDYSGSPPPQRSGDRKLTRVDPETNRVAAEIPIEAGSPSGGAQGVAVGEGAAWVTSVDGKLFEVDPRTNEVLAVVPLGDYSSGLAISGGFVWGTVQTTAPFDVRTRLKQVDPRTHEVVGSYDLGPVEVSGAGRLAAGEGEIWALSAGAGMQEGGSLTRFSPGP